MNGEEESSEEGRLSEGLDVFREWLEETEYVRETIRNKEAAPEGHDIDEERDRRLNEVARQAEEENRLASVNFRYSLEDRRSYIENALRRGGQLIRERIGQTIREEIVVPKGFRRRSRDPHRPCIIIDDPQVREEIRREEETGRQLFEEIKARFQKPEDDRDHVAQLGED